MDCFHDDLCQNSLIFGASKWGTKRIDPSFKGNSPRHPLSPFLFLLCMEWLNSLILKAENEGSIHGFALNRRGPKLTHLLFSDDSLLFCRSSRNECQKVLEILVAYESMSGQKINRGKTSIFFSKSTIETMRTKIKDTLGVPKIRHYEKYLGLPSLVGRHKKVSFDYIKERMWRKL